MKLTSSTRILTTSAAALLALVATKQSAQAQAISLTGAGTYTQNFDTLPTVAGNWVDNSTLSGWFATSYTTTGDVIGAAASPLTLGVYTTGAVRANGFFSAGTGVERALAWGGTTAIYGISSAAVIFKNDTASSMSLGALSYIGELYFETNNVANLDGLSMDYRISSSLNTNVGYTVSNLNGSSHATNAARVDTGWTLLPSMIYSRQGDGDATATEVVSPVLTNTISTPNVGITLLPGEFIALRWRSMNDTGTDGIVGFDNVSLSYSLIGTSLTYNLGHAMGGGNPNGDGIWGVSADQYWQNGVTPLGFADNDIVTFSQNPATVATVDVLSNVGPNSVTISHTSGSYVIGGVGQITSGALTKTGAGNVTLASASSYATVNLNGGTTVGTNALSLGNGVLTISGPSTIQTDADVQVSGISGAGALTKTGTGALAVGGAGSGTGLIQVDAGKLRLDSATALGNDADVTLGNNTTLEYNGPAASSMTFNSTTVTRVLATGANTVSIANNVVATNQAFIFDATDGITGSGTINKEGVGVVRISKAHAGLTANWVVNAGVLEVTGANSALGSGTVTVNPTGVLVANTIDLQNNITLAGGALGTRSNSNANFAGTVNVTASSLINLKSSSTPTGFQGFGGSGVWSGAGNLTLTGAVPLVANVNAATALTLKNAANTYSGTINVTSQTFLANAVTTGTGSALGTSTINLQGGTFRSHDNSIGDNTTVVYGNNVTVSAPSEIGALAGVGTIHVDRQATPGTAVNNTIQFGTLAIAGGQGLGVTGANGYAASFSGAATISTPGDVTIDTSTANLTLAGGFSGTGGLFKTGAGTLTIGTSATHTGNTTVSAGILDVASAGVFAVGAGQTLSGSGIVNGDVQVSGGGVVAPGNGAGIGTLTVSNLTIGGAAINYSWNTGTLGQVTVTTSDALATMGAVTFNFAGQNPNVGLHTLIAYSGTTLSNPQFSNFTIGSLFSRIDAVLQNNAGQVALDVQGVKYPIWSGAVSTEWSTNPIGGAQNWNLNAGGGPTDFITSDKVVFDNSAVDAAPIVDISVGNVTPSSVEVAGSKNYTFNGTAGIAGATTLVNNGTGTLTINNVNSFTGAVALNAGTTSVATVADSGTNSPLGAGTSINLDTTATLEFTGATGSTNRTLTVAAGGGSVSIGAGNTLTLAGVVGGVGTVTKTGAGTVVLTGGTNAVGAITVTAGTLQVGDGSAAGSTGTGLITNNAALVFNTPAANLAITNEIGGTGILTKTGPGNLSLGGTTPNTYTGLTTVTAGTLTLNKPTTVDAIKGDLLINGGSVVFQGNNVSDQINDAASITLDSGSFGNVTASGTNPTNPGANETVANVTVNGGTFSSSRATFTATGSLAVHGGVIQGHRGALIVANSVTVDGTGVIDLDGGSATGGAEPRLRVGLGGLTLTSGTINFNQTVGAAPTATSVGSRLELEGPLTSTGTSNLIRLNTGAAVAVAQVDVKGGDRVINVDGTLNFGTAGATVAIVNSVTGTPSGIIKAGAGDLVLPADNTYNGATTINGGTLTLTGALSGTTSIEVQTGATFNVTGVAGGYALGATQTLKGVGDVVGNSTINGTLAPGSSIGTLDFLNDVTFGATGIAAFEIDKAGLTLTADLANVTSALTLGGTLNVTATGDALVEGDTFNLFDAASFAGTMALGTMPTLDPGLFWDATNLGTDGTISVIPEPGSLALLALGSTLIFRRRRQA